ncbi:MAG: hypothetical protein JXR22_12275 [Prolixibacteraceae bacterium]|nr:hypothetical protein [Prolixibacteraceae bacterium]
MEENIQKAIQQQLIRKAPAGLSNRVMDEVFRLATAKPYQPIISKTMWWIIGAVAALFTALLLFLPQQTTNISGETGMVSDFVQRLDSLDFSWLTVPGNVNLLVISAVSLAIFLLLFFDTYLFRKSLK